MAHARTSPVGHFIRRLSVAHLVAAAPDDELVERFAVHREEAALAALVRRHGPLVLGVCRRVLTDPHAAEDCFQETFLVLARKAGSLNGPEALGPWLYGVATRTALKARAREARRRACERRACVAEAVAPPDALVWRDLRPKLDEAIAGLPERYRTPFVLHHLEGLTVAEVAHRLGCPQGTVSARLARAKERLRARLARQGLAWCAGALATAWARGAAPAAVPAPLAAVTVQAAIGIAAGEAAGALCGTAAALTTGGLRVMSVSKVKVALAVLLTGSVLGVGLGVSQHAGPGGGHAGAGRAATPGARQASGRQRSRDDAPALGRSSAGGFHSLRGFEFRGVPDRESRDTRVDVHEQPAGSLIFGLGVNSDAGLTGSIVLNERNFDIRRPPTRFDDPFGGRAFCGAGQEFRVEAMPGTPPWRYTVSWREPFLFDTPHSLSVSGYYYERLGNEDKEDRAGGRYEGNDTPVSERSFAGGFNSVRGFQSRGAGPDSGGPKPGGDFLFLNSIEYQVPVRANDGIFLDTFVDSGTVGRKVEIKDYRASAGFGVRFVTPMMGPVPIALDLGFPLAQGSGAPQRLFGFWVGFFS
jgi:RNA polymerase sigma factor (sigma-70 family)